MTVETAPLQMPTDAAKRMCLAVAERLGLNPTEVMAGGISISFDGPNARVHITAVLPAQEVAALLSVAAPA